jgi:hypothetical protein
MRVLALLALPLPPVSGHAWNAVDNDWLDNGRFDHAHSCAAVVVAATNANVRSDRATDTQFPHDVRSLARRICHSGNAAQIELGMSNADVASIAGAPRFPISGPHCWAYATRRFCFTGKHVTKIQSVSHGG